VKTEEICLISCGRNPKYEIKANPKGIIPKLQNFKCGDAKIGKGV